MKASRKQDSLIHLIVFKEKLDIAPHYTKDFQDAAVLFEYIFVHSEADSLRLGFCQIDFLFYCELTIETPKDEVTLLKYESTKELAICSLAVAYFSAKYAQIAPIRTGKK